MPSSGLGTAPARLVALSPDCRRVVYANAGESSLHLHDVAADRDDCRALRPRGRDPAHRLEPRRQPNRIVIGRRHGAPLGRGDVAGRSAVLRDHAQPVVKMYFSDDGIPAGDPVLRPGRPRLGPGRRRDRPQLGRRESDPGHQTQPRRKELRRGPRRAWFSCGTPRRVPSSLHWSAAMPRYSRSRSVPTERGSRRAPTIRRTACGSGTWPRVEHSRRWKDTSTRSATVEFSPDGRRIVSASHDQTVRLWDGLTGQPVGTLRGHSDRVIGATFLPDGRRLVSASLDGTLPALGRAGSRADRCVSRPGACPRVRRSRSRMVRCWQASIPTVRSTSGMSNR